MQEKASGRGSYLKADVTHLHDLDTIGTEVPFLVRVGALCIAARPESHRESRQRVPDLDHTVPNYVWKSLL